MGHTVIRLLFFAHVSLVAHGLSQVESSKDSPQSPQNTTPSLPTLPLPTELKSTALQELPRLELDKIIDKIQGSYNRMQTMKAHFDQTYASKLGDPQKNSGELVLKKPGKMKWTYDSPKGKYIVANDERVVLYDPSTKQAIVQLQNQKTKLPMVVSLLMGSVSFKNAFEILKGLSNEKNITLYLKPKEKIPNVQAVELDVEKSDTSKIVKTRIIDDLGGTNEIYFKNIRFNTEVPKMTFETKTPKGATVVTGDPLPS